MKALFSNLAILSSTLDASHVLPRDEGHVWTTPQDSANGSFIFPRTYPLTFREGSSINVSWSTTYDNINLYFYQRGKVATSVQLVSKCIDILRFSQTLLMRPVANLATNWYQWEVRAEETNLTNPFVFRVVNAHGTTEEQNGQGFWSTSWYLSRDDSASKPVTSSSSVAPSSSTTTTMATPSAAPSLSATSSEIPLSTTQVTKTEATAAPTLVAETHDNRVGKTTVIGLTVGLVLAGAMIIGGLWCLLRRRRRAKAASFPVSLPAGSYQSKAYVQKHPEYYSVHEAYAQPSELQGAAPCYELPDKR